jgi:pimeloyl-ACP methyl ester carboxylesterase
MHGRKNEMNLNDSTTTARTGNTSYLGRPGGRIGYDVAGAGPLVVLVPGMGDLRAAYRFLAPALRAAGYRVASTDLRGHGDSDATFSSYGDEETADDVAALIGELGGPAVIVGNSMAAGSAVLAAVRWPELVSGLVLVGPFVRDAAAGAGRHVLLRVAMAPLWAALSWKSYLPKLYAGRRPGDFVEYRDQVVASLRRPGYARAFSRTTRMSHAAAQARLADVTAPVLVVIGQQDPRLPGSGRRSGLDRADHAHAGRHGPRGRALSPVAAARHHHRSRAAVPGDGA